MELFNKVINLIDINLIYCLPTITITIILIELFFKNKFKTKQAFSLIKWIIIFYSILSLIHYILNITLLPTDYGYINRPIIPSTTHHKFMFVCATILPFTLLYKNWGSKAFYLLIIGVLIKIGGYLEKFVIIVTSFHRNSSTNYITSLTNYLFLIFIQGFIIAIMLLIIAHLTGRKKELHSDTKTIN
jgi:hypothetical protein